nr:hypothetical protein Iba_chr09aCG16610 [Ipomoea batatas]
MKRGQTSESEICDVREVGVGLSESCVREAERRELLGRGLLCRGLESPSLGQAYDGLRYRLTKTEIRVIKIKIAMYTCQPPLARAKAERLVWALIIKRGEKWYLFGTRGPAS